MDFAFLSSESVRNQLFLKITDQTDRDPQLAQQKTGQNSSLTVVGQGKSPKKEEIGKMA